MFKEIVLKKSTIFNNISPPPPPPPPDKFLRPTWSSSLTLKKIAFSVGIVLLALSFVTCNFGQSASESGLLVEYTDVVYSADGTQVTLYLDGIGVPVTQSQRALTTDMAKMSHDFYEVVFWTYDSGNPVVARATWEIGQSAGIKGVYLGTDPANGHIYPPTSYITPPFSGVGLASLFVGRKVEKTILAVGQMTHVTNTDGTSSYPYIRSSTKSVTFTVYTIEANLDSNANYIFDTSFITASGNPPYNDVDGTSMIANNMVYDVILGGAPYPYYKLPVNNPSNKVAARYRFRLSTSYPHRFIRIINKPEAIKREPRFLSGGRYYYVQQAKLDTGTTVEFLDPFDDNTYDGNGDFIFNAISLIFDTSNSQGGIFSFTFRIPVYNLTRDPSTNGGGSFTTWYIQPGFGRDLYSLDNGKDAGGCILMGTEDFGDWIDIFTAGP